MEKSRGKSYLELGKFFLDLAKLAYGGGVLVPFGAWALEKKIGTVGFTVVALVFGFLGTFISWLGYRFIRKGYAMMEEDNL